MQPLLITIGLAVFMLVLGLAVMYGIIMALDAKGARYYYNQLLIKIAIGCLKRVEFKSPTNENMLSVVRAEARCLQGCI